MSNLNSTILLQNLPSQTVAGASAVLTVPAAGVFPSVPSPTLPAGGAWFSAINDSAFGNDFDGHPIKVRIAGRVTTGTTSTFTPSVYLGSSTTVANNTTLGIGVASGSLAAGTYSFWLEATLFWDSTTQKLTGGYYQMVNGAIANAGAFANITATSVATVSGLQFLPTFAFGTTNASNAVQLTEFAIDRA